MSEKISIRQAVFGVSGIVLVSKLLGFLREMLIAERFGTSQEYDIFLIAIAAPVFFNLVIVRSANFLTVPLLSKKLKSTNDNADHGAIWSLFNSFLVIILGLVLIVIITAPYLVKLVGSDLQGDNLQSGILYCRLISALLMFGFLESFFRSALNVKKQFVYPVLGTIVLNIIVIATIYFFSAKLSVASILIGLLAGSFIQVLFLLAKLFDFQFLKYFNLRLFNIEVKKAMVVGGAIVAVELLASTYFLIDRYFASDMTGGVVSALNYCSLLVMLPVSIVGLAVASVTFPYLSERSDKSRLKDFSSLLHSALSLSLTVAIPCGFFYFLFSRELTAAVFFRGAFDLASLDITSNLLTYLAPYLVCLFMYTILIQANYSSGYQRPVLYIAIASTIIKFILTYLLKSIYDYTGIAMANSIVQCFTVVLLIIFISSKGRLEDPGKLIKTMAKLVIASVPMMVVAWYYQGLPEFEQNMGILSKMRVVPAGIISFIAFTGVGYFVRVDIIREMVGNLKRRIQ